MMKLVVLLVLIAMTTPAFAQSFQEVLQMFTNLGCKETKNTGAASRFFVRTCDKCLSFSVTLHKADLINCGTPSMYLEEFMQMFTDLGCQESEYIGSDSNNYLRMCDECLSFSMSLEIAEPIMCGIR
uniref:U23-Nephitoxin-Nsp1b_1 n=1 Tax=Nephila sp. SGP-2016 TaxID=1905176 RepID=A0A4Q8K949_9ARAC